MFSGRKKNENCTCTEMAGVESKGRKRKRGKAKERIIEIRRLFEQSVRKESGTIKTYASKQASSKGCVAGCPPVSSVPRRRNGKDENSENPRAECRFVKV